MRKIERKGKGCVAGSELSYIEYVPKDFCSEEKTSIKQISR